MNTCDHQPIVNQQSGKTKCRRCGNDIEWKQPWHMLPEGKWILAPTECDHIPSIIDKNDGSPRKCMDCHQPIKQEKVYRDINSNEFTTRWVLADEPVKECDHNPGETADSVGTCIHCGVPIEFILPIDDEIIGHWRIQANEPVEEDVVPNRETIEAIHGFVWQDYCYGGDKCNGNRHVHADLMHAWAEGAKIEAYDEHKGWYPCEPTWCTSVKYRIAETKPSIDWSHVHPDYNYLTTEPDDEEVRGMLYEVPPTPHEEYKTWEKAYGTKCAEITALASFKAGNCDWQDSLICRPRLPGSECWMCYGKGYLDKGGFGYVEGEVRDCKTCNNTGRLPE